MAKLTLPGRDDKIPRLELAKIVGIVFLSGFVFAAGHKAADWLIPDPPRAPLKLRVVPDIEPEPADESAAPRPSATTPGRNQS